FETDYPTLCKLDSIGTTVEGRKLYVIKISDNVANDETEPEVFYTSTMHGDETTGYILMLRLADYLLSNYNSVPLAKELVDNLQIYINPNANPDGTYNGGNFTVSSATRYNANSIDINRNFPDLRVGNHPDGNQWQPETQAMMNFAAQHHFVLSANFHGGIEVVNYPWDAWTSTQEIHPDNDWFISVCRAYADSAQANSPTGYMTDRNNGITNGGDWYVVAGGRQDYMNFFHRCKEITIELSDVKLLASESLPAHWEYNRSALLYFLQNALFGFGGTVKNASNQPLDAEIIVLNHDRLNSSAKTNPTTGQYYRLIQPGTYDIMAVANGYKPKIISGVTINPNSYTEINFTLESASTLVSDESFENTIPERITFSGGEWIRNSQTANTGSYSLKSAAIGDSKSTSASITFNVRNEGELSFSFKVSSEESYDFFKLYIDNKLQNLWSGETDWTRYITILGQGTHTIKWEYAKDGGTSSGNDCVYIDDITLPKIAGNISLIPTINSTVFENLTIALGDSIRTTDANGMVTYSNFPLDTIVDLKVYSENNLIGNGQAELKWQQVNYSANFDAYFNATFKVKSNENLIEAATINFNNEQKQTDQNGIAVFSNVPFGLNQPYSISKDGYNSSSGELRIASDTIYDISIYPTLTPINRSFNPITVFPNPVNNNFSISFNNVKGDISIKLVDLTSKTIAQLYEGYIIEESFKIVINRNEIDILPGIYFLVTRNGSKTFINKIIFTKP
ncbi:MAG: carboxypeptidase regulatory-like domain-containing protein, partial [Bacteroidales bacterium]|nr:carboxypeptidase regulatory-like domain-containing protein [Bacteroidales bacterium]